MVPTLTLIASIAGERCTALDDDRLAPWLSERQRRTLSSRRPNSGNMAPLLLNARESVRRLHAAGIAILAGTDAPNLGTAHGVSIHEELAHLVAAGLSEVEALAAATSRAADTFNLGDRGRIAMGKRADLLLVRGDPTSDITNTRDVLSVWKNGYRVNRVAGPSGP